VSSEEIFQVDKVVLAFSPASRIAFENGQMQVELSADGASPEKHPKLFDRTPGYGAPTIRVTDIAFPTPEARVSHTYKPMDGARFRPGLWLDGFAEAPTLAGEVRIADGWFVLEGELRRDYGARPGPRILVRKRFEPGEVDPARFTHESLASALAVDAQLVHRLEMGDSPIPVPPELFGLTNLRYLQLSGYEVDGPLQGFARLQHLEWLHLNQARMRAVPEAVFDLGALASLFITECDLEDLSPSIAKLTQLEHFVATNTRLRSVPEELFRLPKLKSVSLQWNELTSLPDVSAATAVDLQLKGNDFTSLPASLAAVKKVGIEAKFKPLYMDASYRNKGSADPKVFSAATDKEFLKRFDVALREHQLTKFRESLLPFARRSLEFTTTTRDDYSKTGNTRFGGEPDLPTSIPFPTAGDYAWIFLAQIDLAEIAPHQDFLPRTGTLSFFVTDLEHVDEVKVIHHAPGTKLARTPPPPDAFVDQGPFEGFRASATRSFSLPHLYRSEVLTEIQEDDARYDRYQKLREVFEPPLQRGENRHGMNVHVFTQNESPEEQAAEKSGGQPEEWMVLLCLGHDGNTGFCFWDAGTLSFMINRSDLARGDFSNVVAFIESS
jgi:uncharacterized protein YwqG